jgi:hypothetical protein
LLFALCSLLHALFSAFQSSPIPSHSCLPRGSVLKWHQGLVRVIEELRHAIKLSANEKD